MADKALLSKNPNDEVLAKDLSERDQSRIFYCAGVNDKGEHCFAPMHLILRSGNALRKGSQYFEEKSSNGSHIPNCSCANKSKDKVRINNEIC